MNQQDYNSILHHLDKTMIEIRCRLGKSESEAQEFLLEFLKTHYFPVWRAMHPDSA